MEPAPLGAFEVAYITAALWSSVDENGSPLDSRFALEDLAPETRERMVTDCQAFFEANADDLAERARDAGGHDLWLTRNGHGAGFWDGDWPEDVGDRLTTAASNLGPFDLYVGDDGKLYGV